MTQIAKGDFTLKFNANWAPKVAQWSHKDL